MSSQNEINVIDIKWKIIFTFWCYGLLACAFLLSVGFSNIGAESERSRFLLILVPSVLLVFAACCLWIIFYKQLQRMAVMAPSLILIMLYSLKVVVLFAGGNIPLLRVFVIGWSGLWTFLPYFLVENAKNGKGWLLFKKYGWIFAASDLIALVGANIKMTQPTMNYSPYPYFLALIIYILFFKYFHKLMGSFKYYIHWDEMNWLKWTVLVVPAILIGLPSFIMFYVFF